MSCRSLARHDTRACRRAEWTVGIGVCEGHAAFGQSLDIWCLIEGRRVVKGGIAPAQIVRQNKNHVELIGAVGGFTNGEDSTKNKYGDKPLPECVRAACANSLLWV